MSKLSEVTRKLFKKRPTKIIAVIVLIFAILLIAMGGVSGIQATFLKLTLGKYSDKELQAMVKEKSKDYMTDLYTDSETGLSVPYNIYLPENYNNDTKYPMVFFIGDMTTAGNTMNYAITQGWGGLVWATDDVQSVSDCIVVTPVYPETILDDHDGYNTTAYVDLTPRMIISISDKYNVDTNRIYGTGQSMGAMTTLYVAANNPDLYAAILIVDGQWDIDALDGIETQNMIYIAAGGDENACIGQEQVKELLDDKGVFYSSIQDLNVQYDRSELETAVSNMLSEGNSINFITWTAGSVLENSSALNSSEHMLSFDYGYKLSCVRSWILSQSK